MQKIKMVLVSVVVMFTVVVAASISLADCGSTTCVGKIQRLYLDGSGDLNIATDGDETALSCSPQSNVYLKVLSTDSRFNQIYAMMLTTFATGQDIGIRINTGTSPCTIAYAFTDSE